MKTLLCLSLLASVGIASASFDLVLIGDANGSSTGPTVSKIHRYDGDTGVYMGSFGSSTNPYGALAVSSSNSLVYAVAGSYIQVWNYSTGAFVRQFNQIGTRSIKLVGNDLWLCTQTQIRRINVTSGANTLLNSFAGSNYQDLVVMPSGAYAAIDETTGFMTGFSSAGSVAQNYALTNYGSGGRVTQVAGLSNRIFSIHNNAGNPAITQTQDLILNSSGTMINQGAGNFIFSYFNNGTDVEAAHDGFWMMGKNNAGQNAMYRRSAGDTHNGYFTIGQVSNPSGAFAVVVAPEPGTLIGLGVGAAALLKRRRKG